MLAVWDGVSNWRVGVMKQPTRTYDLARDFGAVPASIINSSECYVSDNLDFTCNGASLTQADKGDVVVAEGLGTGNEPFVGSIAAVTSSTTFTLTNPTTYNSSTSQFLEIIDGITVDPTNADGISSGSNYSFTGSENLHGSLANVTPVTGMQMALGAIVSASIHTSTSGFTVSSCTGSLAQSIGTPLAQNTTAAHVAMFNITASGGLATSVTPASVAGEGLYRGFSGYSYGGSGYTAVPVTLSGCGSGASLTINVEFGVVTENLSQSPNGYTTVPCTASSAAMTDEIIGYGTGLELYCTSHTPWASAYTDAQGAMENAIDFESAQNTKAHQPVCVTVRGRFGITPIPWTSHIVNGAPCFIGDAQNESGFFKTPNAAMGAIIPFADASSNGGQSTNGVQLSDPHQGSLAGPWLQNLSFWGLWPDPSDSYAVINFGDTEWGTYENLSCFGWRVLCSARERIPSTRRERWMRASSIISGATIAATRAMAFRRGISVRSEWAMAATMISSAATALLRTGVCRSA
jgi:hypothetical protein